MEPRAQTAGRRGLRPADWFRAPSPVLGRGYLALLGLAAAALSLAQSWPLPASLPTAVGQELRDPALLAWAMAWQRHAVLTPGVRFWDGNALWPADHTLAFSDALIGYLPVTLLFGAGAEQAVLRYNVCFLLSYVLAFVGAALLARELGAGAWASGVAGVAYAYAPWRLGQNNHLHVLSSGALPLAVFLLVRGYRQRRPGLVLAGWLCGAWQVSFGWSVGIQAVYLLAGAHLVAAVAWLLAGRPALPRRVVAAAAAGAAAFLAWTGWQARPYLAVQDANPQALRTLEEVERFSPPWRSLLAAPPESWLWGDPTAVLRDTLQEPAETALLPALLTVALAVVGARGTVLGRWTAVALAGAVVTTWLFAMGTRLHGGRWTYVLLHDHAPGWAGVRTPGRLVTLTTLALALLAAAGATALARRAWARTGTAAALVVVPLVAAGGVLVEGWGRLPVVPVPRGPALPANAGPLLHLPSSPYVDSLYMLWSTERWPVLVNGWSGVEPGTLRRAREAAASLPDDAAVEQLRALGVRTVVVHPDRVAGTPYEQVPGRLARSAPGAVVDRGDVLLVELRP